MFSEPESATGRLPVEGTSSGPAHSHSKVEACEDDLVRADHFSEVVLLGGEVIFVSLWLLVIAALTRV